MPCLLARESPSIEDVLSDQPPENWSQFVSHLISVFSTSLRTDHWLRISADQNAVPGIIPRIALICPCNRGHTDGWERADRTRAEGATSLSSGIYCPYSLIADRLLKLFCSRPRHIIRTKSHDIIKECEAGHLRRLRAALPSGRDQMGRRAWIESGISESWPVMWDDWSSSHRGPTVPLSRFREDY